MATRSIVTSQPDVACDVCGRRLLRGELPDVFLAGGQRRTVCELCAPRAAHEGWLREADRHSVSLPPSRARRGRNLFERLRPQREPSAARAAEGFAGEGLGLAPAATGEGHQTESYDFLEAIAAVPENDSATTSTSSSGEYLTQDQAPEPVLTAGELKVERALEVFNAGEHPRRVAGVARSLGEPSVAARPLADSGSVVSIVVAWELSWYRYEVDLGDEAAGANVSAQGTELGELTQEELLVNASADKHGALRFLPV
ncbi:MAG TPA: hypothetical protein VGL54_05705 [Solirubrobacteraceae bacterium]|jgi:hypothetical protein